MAINRTIKEPGEKLYKLFKYIRDNELNKDLFESDKSGIHKIVFVSGKNLCEILGISKQVLKSWNDNKNSMQQASVSYFYGIKVMHTYDAKSTYQYFSLSRVVYFLMHEYDQYLKNRNLTISKHPDSLLNIKDLYDTMHIWHIE
jgi:hypothetical protein